MSDCARCCKPESECDGEMYPWTVVQVQDTIIHASMVCGECADELATAESEEEV